MKTAKYIMVIFFALCLAVPSVGLAGKGKKGKGKVVVAEEQPADKGGGGGGGGGNNSPTSDIDFGDMVEVFRLLPNGIPELDVNGCEILVNALDGSEIPMEYDSDSGHCSIPEGEPVTEVSFGRLNVVRAPPDVLESGFDEAINAINEAIANAIDNEATTITITLDAGGRLLLTRLAEDADGNEYEYVKAIDSPRENLALYKKLMLDGHLEGNLGDNPNAHVGDPQGDEVLRPVLDVDNFTEATGGAMPHLLNDDTVLTVEDLMSAASFLAAAADKTGHITVDLVFYLNTILGFNTKNQQGVYDTYVVFDPMTYYRESVYDKDVYVLVPELDEETGGWVDGHWVQAYVGLVSFDDSGNLVSNPDVFTWDILKCVGESCYWDIAIADIAGFAQASDDALRVISYTHDNEIPPAPEP